MGIVNRFMADNMIDVVEQNGLYYGVSVDVFTQPFTTKDELYEFLYEMILNDEDLYAIYIRGI